MNNKRTWTPPKLMVIDLAKETKSGVKIKKTERRNADPIS